MKDQNLNMKEKKVVSVNRKRHKNPLYINVRIIMMKYSFRNANTLRPEYLARGALSTFLKFGAWEVQHMRKIKFSELGLPGSLGGPDASKSDTQMDPTMEPGGSRNRCPGS